MTLHGVVRADDALAMVPLFEGLGNQARGVTAADPVAGRYVNQGLAFLYAFNHDEAIRSFEQATKIDPACPLAWWGIAYAQGPHINNPIVTPERVKQAVAALTEARKHAGKGNAVEQAMIAALSKRYVDPQPEDRAPLDQAYAAAMAEVWKQFPDDSDVGAFYAEALMDLHPWDLWTAEGKPQEWTPQVLSVLQDVLRRWPNHPLAMHLYIHAVEASDQPDRADAVADRLRTAAPGLGHLVHMPSHIDVRCGRWQRAATTNERAIEADAQYAKRSGHPQGFYRLYMSHNYHMLAFAALMRGQSERAIAAIDTMLAAVPPAWLEVEENRAIADGFLAMPYEMLVRFGKWDRVLQAKEPEERFPIARGLYHHARGIAFGAKGQLTEARAAQKAFRQVVGATPEEARFGNNTASDLFAVADKQLEGELLLREGKIAEGLSELRAAVAREDALKYDEPPDWIQPVRHALGAALLNAGEPAAAEKVYREDLRRWPGNGWSLFGLAECLAAQNNRDEAARIRQQFERVWKDADIKLTASCFCQARDSRTDKK